MSNFSIHYLYIALKSHGKCLMYLGLLVLELREKMKIMVKGIDEIYKEMESIINRFAKWNAEIT